MFIHDVKFVQDVGNLENVLIVLLPLKKTKHFHNQKVIMKMVVGGSNVRFLYSLQLLERLFLEKTIDIDNGVLEIQGVAIYLHHGLLCIDHLKSRKGLELEYNQFYQAVNEFVQQDRKERINLKRK